MRRLRNTPIAFHIAGAFGLVAIVVGVAMIAFTGQGETVVVYDGSYTSLETVTPGFLTRQAELSALAIGVGVVAIALWAGRVSGARPDRLD